MGRTESDTRTGGARSVLPVGLGCLDQSEHHGPGGDRRGEFRIVGRQRGQPLREDRIALARALQELLWRQPVHFRHQDVDADGQRLIALDVADQFRQQGSWPRPLTERLEAPVVDFDDHGRRALDLAWRARLKGVEPERL